MPRMRAAEVMAGKALVLQPIFNLKGTSATHEINAKAIYIALLFF